MKPFESATDILSDNAVGSALGKVDLGATISSMGIGIAKAQQALDNNSINQLLALKSPQDDLGGRSLLEMGFIPAFYHFQSATLSASVALSMEVSQETEFGLEVDVDSNTTVNKSSTKGVQKITNTNRDISWSKDKVKTVSDSSISSIYDYNESTSASDDYLMLADKVAVSESKFTGYENETSGSVNVNRKDGIIFVPEVQNRRWAVWKIVKPTNSNTDFSVFHSSAQPQNITVQSGTSAKATAELLRNTANAVTGITAYILGADINDLTELHFNHNKPYLMETTSDLPGVNFRDRAIALGRVLSASGLTPTKFEGHCDASGSAPYNLQLSENRANYVKSVVITNAKDDVRPVPAIGKGESGNAHDVQNRRVDVVINIPADEYYVYVLETVENGICHSGHTPAPDPRENSFLHDGVVGPLTLKTNPITVSSGETSAQAVARTINDSETEFRASAEGDFVHILKNETEEYAKVEIFAKDESQGFKHGETSFSLTGTKDKSKTKSKTSEKNVNRTTAVGVSVNARYSRQFNVSMSGNCSITAEMVALPPPEAFLTFIQSLDTDG